MAATDPVHNPTHYRFYRLLALAGAASTVRLRIEHHEHVLTIALWTVLSVTVLFLMARDRRDRLARTSPVVSPGEQP